MDSCTTPFPLNNYEYCKLLLSLKSKKAHSHPERKRFRAVRKKIKSRITLFENYSNCRIWIFEFWHFPSFFVLLKCLVTLFDHKFLVMAILMRLFKWISNTVQNWKTSVWKSPKLSHFNFSILIFLSYQKWPV